MNDQFEPLNPIEFLNNVGIQKIYEKTHISKKNLELLFSKEFDKLDKIRAIGFVSILHREYKIDLSELKSEILEFYKVEPVKKNIIYSEVQEVKKSKKVLPVILFFLIFGSAGYYFLEHQKKLTQVLSSTQELSSVEDDLVIDTIEKEREAFENVQKDINETQIKKEKVVTSLLAPIVLEPLIIKPRKKVWLGYIDLDTLEKVQKTTKIAFELDPEKRWLMIFGHGLVDISQGDERLDFTSKKNLYLFYENGLLKEIGKKEFKALNRGKMW